MDRISSLPDEILSHILSFLPTKYAVGTSILSSRWTQLWASVPVIDLDNRLYLHPERKRSRYRHKEDDEDEDEDEDETWTELFISFVDKVLSLNRSPNFVKFRLNFYVPDWYLPLTRYNGWIQTVVLRNVVELDLNIFVDYSGVEYLRLSPCQSLQVLKFNSTTGLYMPTSEGCFPNLRMVDVNFALQLDDDGEITTKLFRSLPRLEQLSLSLNLTNSPGETDFEITGTALKSLDMNLSSEDFEYDCAKVAIDAPHLEYLNLRDNFLASYLVKNLPTICEVKLDVGYYEGYDQHYLYDDDSHVYANRSIKLLQGISNAKSLSISASTMQALLFAQVKNLPVFRSLTKLELIVYPSCGWNLLLHWLQSSPNLEFLVLKKEGHVEVRGTLNWRAPESVPTCLLLHLKEIEIRGLGKREKDKVLKYLLNNAKVLEKITVDSHKYNFLIDSHKNVEDGVLQGLLLL